MLASRNGGIGQPEKRDTIEAEVGIDQGNVFFESHLRFRSIKLPGGLHGIANGEPAVMDDVNIGGTALELDRAMNVVKGAASRSDIENGIVAFEMLIFKVEENVPVGNCLGGGV